MGIVTRQSLKGTFVNYIGVVLGIFVQLYIVTEFLDPEVIGLKDVLYKVAFMLSSMALLGSGSTGMRFFPYFKDKESGNHGFLYYYLMMPVVGSVVMILLYVLMREPIEGYFGKNSPLFNEYFYYVIPLMVVLAFWAWSENYANIHMRIALPKAVREVGMRLIMLFIFLAYGSKELGGFGLIGVKGLVICFILGYSLCMIVSGTYALSIGDRTLKHDWSFITPELRSKMLKYAAFLTFSALSTQVIDFMDAIMVASVKGLYHAGIYSICIYMAEIVNLPARNITAISTPLAAEAMKSGDIAKMQALYKQVSVHQMLASTVLLLIVWINLDCIFELIPNGEIFAAGKWAVLFLGLSKVIYGTLNFGNVLISFSKYYYWTLFITVVLAAISVGTNLYFIPIYGLSGAALATFITVMVSYSYQQYLVQAKVHTNPFSWAHLRILVILAVLFLVNCLIPSLSAVSPWLDIAVRSSIVVLIAAVLVYALKISPQITNFINKLLKVKS